MQKIVQAVRRLARTRTPRYVTELVQTDPVGSPTPGYSHYAGQRRFTTRKRAERYGTSLVGKSVPKSVFHPCCEWQKRESPITGYTVIEDDDL